MLTTKTIKLKFSIKPNSANNEEKLNLICIEIHTYYSKNQYVVIEGYVKK